MSCREAFIKEQMRKRLGQTEDDAKASSSQLHPEDELYAVPADLQVTVDCKLRQHPSLVRASHPHEPILSQGMVMKHSAAGDVHCMSDIGFAATS